MRAPAAGCAGGHIARTAGLLTTALATGLLTTGLLGTTSAAAAPPGAAAAAASSDPERPVTIEIGQLPRTVTDDSTVRVTGTLTNTGTSPVRDINLRLQRGNLMTTRAELVSADEDADEAGADSGDFVPVEGVLRPGATRDFSYSVEVDELGLTEDGVYPVLVNVNGTTVDGLVQRVGELSTYLVRRPAVPDEKTTVAWLWPVAADTSRPPTGGFADDHLARSVSGGGRVDRALAVLEGLPRTEEGGEATAAVPVALAVDPAVVEELGIMARGPYTVGPDDIPGEGTDAARSFLDRLRALAAVHPVVALPYGDVDADALHSVGLDDVVTRSLPGIAAGTAQGLAPAVPDPQTEVGPTGTAAEPTEGGAADPPGDTAPFPTAPAPGTANLPDGDAAAEAALGAGARILTDALGVEPRTDLGWAAGGSFRPDTVETLREGGIDTLVLGPAGVSRGARAVGLEPGAARARAAVATDEGELGVLVADTGLGRVVDQAQTWPGGPRVAEQRYLAELALIGQQAPDGSTATVLVAPSREVEAAVEGAGQMMADTAGLPWLQPSSLAAVEADRPLDAGRLTDPADGVLLDPAGLADVVAAEGTRDDLADAVVGEPDDELSSFDAATARTVSVSLRSQAGSFRTGASALRTAVGRLLDKVSLLAPADGTYSLASRDSPLPLTVQNDLPFAVSVQVDLSTPSTRSIRLGDLAVQTLAPGRRTTLEVPTEVQQNGRFTVSALLRTPGGAALGETVRLQVRSTAYGTISLLITFGAGGLLGLLFLRRLVHFVRRRRAVPAAVIPELPAAAPEGAAVPVPPTRSPV